MKWIDPVSPKGGSSSCTHHCILRLAGHMDTSESLPCGNYVGISKGSQEPHQNKLNYH